MGAPFGRSQTGPRTAPQRRELALDLTRNEVVLHEGNAEEGWRRFAGVALDDPVFLDMIGLLRAEAEEALGGARPVRLWLPAEQVLVAPMAIAETDPEARLAAAFDRIADTTGHDPDEVALAVSPAQAGAQAGARATVLVAFAETLEEARDYAGRWGFRPGPVSTRHHAADFAPAEPVFRLRRTLGKPDSPAGARAPWAALGIAAVAWALTAAPAEADAAPGRTPIPAARAGDSAPMAAAPAPAGDPAGESTGDPAGESTALAFLPPPRPRDTGPDRGTPDRGTPDRASADGTAADRVNAPPPAEPEAAGDANWSVAPSEPAADTGGLSGPLPPARPARAAPANPAAAPATFPTIGAAAPPPARATAAGPSLPVDRVALLGILNLDSGREALLRLPGGEFVTVGVGDVIEGWRVSAIGLDAMRVSRDGEDRTLLLVSR